MKITWTTAGLLWAALTLSLDLGLPKSIFFKSTLADVLFEKIHFLYRFSLKENRTIPNITKSDEIRARNLVITCIFVLLI